MPALTNFHDRCHILNLDPEGHGPYLVSQTGYQPGDLAMVEHTFFLRRDGRWMDSLVCFMAQDYEILEPLLFGSTGEVLRVFDTLSGKPVEMQPLPFSQDQMRVWVESNPQVKPGLSGVQRLVEKYRSLKGRRQA